MTLQQFIADVTKEVGQAPCHTYERKNGGVEYDVHWPSSVSTKRYLVHVELRHGTNVVAWIIDTDSRLTRIPCTCTCCGQERKVGAGYLKILRDSHKPFICAACKLIADARAL